jgi:hypothetical protein
MQRQTPEHASTRLQLYDREIASSRLRVWIGGVQRSRIAKVVQSLDLIAPKQTIGVGEAVQLVATPRDPNGVAINTVRANYISLAPAIANVGTDGRVIGVSSGMAQITATAGQITQSLTFIVVPGNVAAVVTMPSNTFTPARSTIRVGETGNGRMERA